MSHSTSSPTRRSFIARALGLVAAMAGARLVTEAPPMAAEKKQKRKLTKVQIAERAQAHADQCQALGNTPETSAKPGGTTVTCTSSDGSQSSCTFYSRGVRCHASAGNPGALPDLHTPPPWVDPGNAPDDPLEPTEPTMR